MNFFLNLKPEHPGLYSDMEESSAIINETIMDLRHGDILELEKNISLELVGIDSLTVVKEQIEAGELSAVEAVFGPALESAGVDLSGGITTMESIIGKIKSGLHRVWEFIAKMVAWVKDFFAKRFGAFKKYAKALTKRKKDLLADNKGIKFLNKVGGSEEKVSHTTMEYSTIKHVVDNIAKSNLITKWENIDDIAKTDTPYVKVTPDEEDGIETYEVEDKLDDLLDTDRNIGKIIVKGEAIENFKAFKASDEYIKTIEKAIALAKSLGNGKLYSAITKSLNKVSKKIDKELKKASYSDDEKDNAKTMRNQLSAKNKVTKIVLKTVAAAMSSLLAPSVSKLPKGATKSGDDTNNSGSSGSSSSNNSSGSSSSNNSGSSGSSSSNNSSGSSSSGSGSSGSGSGKTEEEIEKDKKAEKEAKEAADKAKAELDKAKEEYNKILEKSAESEAKYIKKLAEFEKSFGDKDSQTGKIKTIEDYNRIRKNLEKHLDIFEKLKVERAQARAEQAEALRKQEEAAAKAKKEEEEQLKKLRQKLTNTISEHADTKIAKDAKEKKDKLDKEREEREKAEAEEAKRLKEEADKVKKQAAEAKEKERESETKAKETEKSLTEAGVKVLEEKKETTESPVEKKNIEEDIKTVKEEGKRIETEITNIAKGKKGGRKPTKGASSMASLKSGKSGAKGGKKKKEGPLTKIVNKVTKKDKIVVTATALGDLETKATGIDSKFVKAAKDYWRKYYDLRYYKEGDESAVTAAEKAYQAIMKDGVELFKKYFETSILMDEKTAAKNKKPTADELAKYIKTATDSVKIYFNYYEDYIRVAEELKTATSTTNASFVEESWKNLTEHIAEVEGETGVKFPFKDRDYTEDVQPKVAQWVTLRDNSKGRVKKDDTPARKISHTKRRKGKK